MKKTILSIGVTAMLAFAITGCQQGNVEEMMKQDLEKSNSLVQTQIDALNMSLDSLCTAQIEDAANLKFQAYVDSMSKVPGAKKVVVKPKPKPVTPKETKVEPNTNTGKKDANTGENTGKKDATTTPQGTNLGKKK